MRKQLLIALLLCARFASGSEEKSTAEEGEEGEEAWSPLEPPAPPSTPPPPLAPAPTGKMYASTVTLEMEFGVSLVVFYNNMANFSASLLERFPRATDVDVEITLPSSDDYGGYSGYGDDSGGRRRLSSKRVLSQDALSKRELSTRELSEVATFRVSTTLVFTSSGDAAAASGVLMAATPAQLSAWVHVAVSKFTAPSVTFDTLAGIPSPPPPPNPPSMPNAVSKCLNTCGGLASSVFDGTCDDTGEETDGVRYAGTCPTGTDCYDCGEEPRSACEVGKDYGCSEQCRAVAFRNAKKGQPFCHRDILGDGVCDIACNIWECGHDAEDCDEETIRATCKVAHESTPKFWAQHPGNYTPATMQSFGVRDASKLVATELVITSFEPVSIKNEDGLWELTAPRISISMRWRDSRLANAPCRAGLSTLYSLDEGGWSDNVDERIEKENDKAIIWFPRVTLAGSDVSTFRLAAPCLLADSLTDSLTHALTHSCTHSCTHSSDTSFLFVLEIENENKHALVSDLNLPQPPNHVSPRTPHHWWERGAAAILPSHGRHL